VKYENYMAMLDEVNKAGSGDWGLGSGTR